MSIGYLNAYPVTSYQSDSVERHDNTMVYSVFIAKGNCAGFQFTDGSYRVKLFGLWILLLIPSPLS